MASVTVVKTHANPHDTSSPMRWYVWTRGRSGKRKVRIETYMTQMALAGRTEHAINVLNKAKLKGYNAQTKVAHKVDARESSTRPARSKPAGRAG